MEYEIQRSAKSCAATGREFAPGEEFYSVLIAEGAELKRCDYWSRPAGPPPGTVGWWKSRCPTSTPAGLLGAERRVAELF